MHPPDSTGYLALESSEWAAYVTSALEAWIDDNLPELSRMAIRGTQINLTLYLHTAVTLLDIGP